MKLKEESEESPNTPLVGKRTPLALKFAFFVLGAASNVAWNGVLLSVSYFQQSLGPSVLSQLGIAQNAANLLVMIWLLYYRSYMAWPMFRLKVLAVAFIYMICMSLGLLSLVVTNNSISALALYVAISFNGICTGTALALVAQFAGCFEKFSLTGGVLALQIVGASFGNLFPVIFQLIFIPITSKAPDDQLPDLGAEIAGITFCAAALIMIVALWALIRIKNTSEFEQVMEEEEEERIEGLRLNGNFKDTTLSSHPEMVEERMDKLYHSAFMVFVLLTVVCWMLMKTPHISPTKASRNAFWEQYLGTFLISTGACFTFAGQIFAANVKISSPTYLYIMTFGYLLFFAFLWFYIEQIPEWIDIHDSLNESIFATFVLAALIYGSGVVWLSDYAQRRVGNSNAEPCPLTGQVIWLSIQAGAVFGIALSFIPTD